MVGVIERMKFCGYDCITGYWDLKIMEASVCNLHTAQHFVHL